MNILKKLMDSIESWGEARHRAGYSSAVALGQLAKIRFDLKGILPTPMVNKGRNKLMEECGELVQILAKKNALPEDCDIHWDQKGSVAGRMEEEIADVIAASIYVIENNKLNQGAIQRRVEKKLATYAEWAAGIGIELPGEHDVKDGKG
jgi:NTP pyrophosphatase (non-canonical NTP hydrolase)